MNDPTAILTLSTARRWANAVRRTEQGAISTPAGMTNHHQVQPGTHFRFEIAASPTRDGSNWRWVYSGTAKIKSSAGFTGWIDDPRFSGAVILRNTPERSNGTTGLISGYELDDGANETRVTGILPIEAGLIVEAWAELFIVTGTLNVEWWFTERNIPIVTCPEAA
jgi:hypothetical protein